MNDGITVSVFCTAYNHEKYIRQCLDSFVMQKTSFKFEVLINDDASTDHTADIIREYERRYPDIIKPIYQKENQYSQGIDIAKKFFLPRARGKYIAFCEGDDYWCSEDKLQLQYDALEQNDDCHFCVHKTLRITESGENTNSYYPEVMIRNGLYSDYEYFEIKEKNSYLFHTTSYFVKRSDHEAYLATSLDFKNEFAKTGIGDEAMLLYYGSLGKTFYIDKVMSCYRVQSLGSWSSRQREFSNEKKLFRWKQSLKAYESFNKYSNYKYNTWLQLPMDTFRFNKMQYEDDFFVKKLFSCLSNSYFKQLSYKEKRYFILFFINPKIPLLLYKLRHKNIKL